VAQARTTTVTVPFVVERDEDGVVVSVHGNRDVAKGTLRGILGDVGITIDELAPEDPTPRCSTELTAFSRLQG